MTQIHNAVAALISVAKSQIGVKEEKGNKGANVAKYMAVVGLPVGYSWCAGFVCWCVKAVGPSPLKFSGGVLRMWQLNKELRVTEPQPGDIFIMEFSGGKGHTGIVTGVTATQIQTIEGNTNDGGSREGDGVYKRIRLRSVIKGYLRPF